MNIHGLIRRYLLAGHFISGEAGLTGPGALVSVWDLECVAQ